MALNMGGIAAFTLLVLMPSVADRPVTLPDSLHLPLAESSAFLLGDSRVRDELHATDIQSRRWAELFQTYQRKQLAAMQTWQAQNKDSDAIDERVLYPIEQEYAQEALRLATRPQTRRLEQILRQVKGPRLLNRGDIAEQFSLTVGQRRAMSIMTEKLDRIDDDTADALAQRAELLTHSGKDEPGQETVYRQQLSQLIVNSEAQEAKNRVRIKSIEAEMLLLLNGDQFSRWQAWVGAQFAYAR